jgi:hypothetical protein
MNPGCFFIQEIKQELKVAIVYIYPHAGADGHIHKAVEFLETYHSNPPGLEHETIIVCNGAPVNKDTQRLFSGLPNCRFINHSGSGKDIGGYQLAAQHIACDLMVFLGGNTYFRRPNWLYRMGESWLKYGDTLYGTMGSAGGFSNGIQIHPHIRTTGFAMSPDLMNLYPVRVTKNSQRYPFEHGSNCLTSWIYSQGKEVWIVGWSGEYPLAACNSIPNGYHNNDQSDLIIGDRLSKPPYWHTP